MTAINKRENYDDTPANMNETSRSGILYLVIGAGIGAAAALLLAPKSGAAMREDLSEIAQRGYGQTTDLARRVKEQSTVLLDTVRTKAGDVLDLAGITGAFTNTEANATAGDGNDEMSTAIHRLQEKFGKKDSNASREASDII